MRPIDRALWTAGGAAAFFGGIWIVCRAAKLIFELLGVA